MKLVGTLLAVVLLSTCGTSVYASQKHSSHIYTQIEFDNQPLLERLMSELIQSHIRKKGLHRLSGNVSNVVIHGQVKGNKREYVLFSYTLINKPRFGIQVYEDGSDGSWTYSTRSSMYENPEVSVQVLFNHLEQNPIAIAGRVNHPSINKIKINFKNGQADLLPAKKGRFLFVINGDYSNVTSVEGLDSTNQVVF